MFQSDWQFDNSALDNTRADALDFLCYLAAYFRSVELGHMVINTVR